MESELNVVFAYLKCLQYLQFRKSGFSQSQIAQLKRFVASCSREFSRIPEDEKRLLDAFLLKHHALFPHLGIASLDHDPFHIESCCSRELAIPKDTPFFIDISHLWLRVQHFPLNTAIAYMDWCWKLNPSTFVSVLVELLEYDNDLPKDKFVSWIVGALYLEDAVLLEFIKHSCGRLRDICGQNSILSSAFTAALSKALYKDKFQTDPHRSNLRKYVECFRLACHMSL
uniref:Expressed protein n=1 Tax=Echinococcus granulosus TaxID=6210 RepID=A0A068WR79_ECHGR|nr:expressed protein [Echinococcus granulosus]